MAARSGPLLIVLALLLSLPADAGDLFGESWYGAAMLSYLDDDADRDTDDGFGVYQLSLGRMLADERSAIEFSAIAAFLNADGFNADQEQWGFGLDYIHRFGNTDFLVPYAVVGGGFISTSHDDPTRPDLDGSGITTSLGVGVLTPINLFDLNLRIELRLRTDHSVGTRRDYLLSFGLQRKIYPKPVLFDDSDGDGVVDPQDRCEGTQPGSDVDAYGCARSSGFSTSDNGPGN